MRTSGWLTLVVAGLIALASCSSGRVPAAPPTTPYATGITEEKKVASSIISSMMARGTPDASATITATEAEFVPAKTYVITSETGEGYRTEMTMELALPQRGTSAELDDAWRAAGGDGGIPCVGESGAASTLEPERALVYIGRVTVRNLSEGFEPQPPRFAFYQHGLKNNFFAVEYSDGAECRVLYSVSEGPAIYPDMESDQWGPVPILIWIDSVYTPKSPKGEPSPAREPIDIMPLLGGTLSIKLDGKPQSDIRLPLPKKLPR